MPEVMEIRKYCDFIRKTFKNKNLESIKIVGGRYKKHKPFELYNEINKKLPLKLIDIHNKGKFIYFELENDYYILNTLGLSGGWTYKIDSKDKTKNKYILPTLLTYLDNNMIESYLLRHLDHINVEFEFNNGTLYFFDMLSFGTIKIIEGKKELEKKLKHIGPDIMDINTTWEVFHSKIFQKNNLDKEIGNVIVKQNLISGIGNYIRADALWLSQISPFRKVKTLTEDDLKRLYHALKVITWGNYDKKKAIKMGILKKTDKAPHDYKTDFFVYRRDKDIYGNPIIKEELYEGSQKRFIHWVPSYQI